MHVVDLSRSLDLAGYLDSCDRLAIRQEPMTCDHRLAERPARIVLSRWTSAALGVPASGYSFSWVCWFFYSNFTIYSMLPLGWGGLDENFGVWAATAMAITLSGCAEYQEQRAAEQAARAQAIADSEDAQCRSYGAQPGSPAYVQCRMNFDNQRAQMQTAIASQLLSRSMAPPVQQPQTLNVNVCNQPGQVNT
jgi:hypothetical protein